MDKALKNKVIITAAVTGAPSTAPTEIPGLNLY